MTRTEKQLQAAYEKEEISLREFHESLSKIGAARHTQGYCQEKEPGPACHQLNGFKTRRKMETKYLSCAETAKLVRAALKNNFPGVEVLGAVERLQRGSLDRCVVGAGTYD